MKALLLIVVAAFPLRALAQRNVVSSGMAGSTTERGSMVWIWGERNDTTWLEGAVVFRDSTPYWVSEDGAANAADRRLRTVQADAFKAGRDIAGGFRGPHSEIVERVVATGVIEVDGLTLALPRDSTTVLLIDRDAAGAKPRRMVIARTLWPLPPQNPDTAAHAAHTARAELQFEQWRRALRADRRMARLLAPELEP